MTRLCERADALAALAHKCLLAVVASEGFYLAIMLLFRGILNADVFMTSNHIISPLLDYVIVPWSGAMLGIYLMREKKKGGLDIWALVLLILWMIVPFVMRFGPEFFTLSSSLDYALIFFVFYASVRQSDAARRARQLDIACACICVISIALAGTLLYCAATGKTYFSYWDTQHFGVVNGQLQHAMHYNSTGMLALMCMMMCLVGLCRSAKKPYAVLYLIAVVMMGLVIVLTQSRTSRYCMLGALALGAWKGASEYLPIRRQLLRQTAAIACALVVLAGSYKLCGWVTDAALAHYAGAPSPVAEVIVPSALAEDGTRRPVVMQARDQSVDATFSDRTNIWKNVLRGWKNNPRHMLIGNGVGRTKWMVSQNTIHEDYGFASVHNAYLHFAAEFGWIGFGLLAMALGSMVPSALRVFFAGGKKRMPGGFALCLVVLTALATGMMESATLEAMTPISMMMFFALAHIQATGKEMKNEK